LEKVRKSEEKLEVKMIKLTKKTINARKGVLNFG
jgi:hypothetical protein